MPGDACAVVGVLGEEAGRPAEDIRPDDILDRIEDAGIAHQVLTQYHVQRKRAAVKDQDGGPREAASQATPKPASEPRRKRAKVHRIVK